MAILSSTPWMNCVLGSLCLTYSRWLLVHVNDSVMLLSVHPDIFVVHGLFIDFI